MYIIDPTVEDQARADLIARFNSLIEQNGGKVDRVDEWGKRRLAYTIDYKTEGYYVLLYITAPSTLPKELERNMQISDSVLRYMVIRFEGELPPKREPLRPYAQTAQATAEETTAPAEEAAAAEEAAPVAEQAEEATAEA